MRGESDVVNSVPGKGYEFGRFMRVPRRIQGQLIRFEVNPEPLNPERFPPLHSPAKPPFKKAAGFSIFFLLNCISSFAGFFVGLRFV